jgi:hypothetical protein
MHTHLQPPLMGHHTLTALLLLLLLQCSFWGQHNCQQTRVTAPVQAVDHHRTTAAAAAVGCRWYIEAPVLQPIPLIQDYVLLPVAVWPLLLLL